MSFNQGLGGLLAAEQNLNLIGKNISNGNTTGYKTSSIDFTTVLAETVAPNGTTSIGTASAPPIGNINQSFTQGTIAATNNPLDIAIDGKGFFQMQDPITGKLSYTRDGSFQLNGQNQIVNSTGLLLTGYAAGVQGGKATPIDLSKYQRSTGALSATITPTINLSVSSNIIPSTTSFDPTNATTYNYTTSTTGLDNVGRSYTLQMFYAKDPSSTTSTSVYNIYTSYTTPATVANTTLAGKVFFDSTGVVTKVMPNAPVTKPAGTNTLSGIPIGQPPGLSQTDIDTITASIDGTSSGLTNSSGITQRDYTAQSPAWVPGAASTPAAAALAATAAIKNSTTLTDKQISDFGFYIQNLATTQANKITPTSLGTIDPAVVSGLQNFATASSLANTSVQNAITSLQGTSAMNSPQAMATALSAAFGSGQNATAFTNALNAIANMPASTANTLIAAVSPNFDATFAVTQLGYLASASQKLTGIQQGEIYGAAYNNSSQYTSYATMIQDLNGVALTPATPTFTNAQAITAVLNAATSYTIGNAQSVNLALDNLTQSGQASQTTAMSNTSTSVGTLENFSIGEDGSITGVYSNAQTENIGSIALANFTSTAGLQPYGNNSWVATTVSGQAIVGQPSTGGLGSLKASSLEGSNEDQTSDMVALLAAQRAFQANAQSIKAQDQIAQTLVNL